MRKLSKIELNDISGGLIRIAIWKEQTRKTGFKNHITTNEQMSVDEPSFVINSGEDLIWVGNNLFKALDWDWTINRDEYPRDFTRVKHWQRYKPLLKILKM